jgi:hypothetical protein
MQRAITCVLAAVLALVVVAASTALACSTDSEGLELINGELPGGG